MTDLYLKAPTEEDMMAALDAAGVVDENGDPYPSISIDHIGPFSKVVGYTPDGEPIVEDYPDWHTNLRGDFSQEQLELLAPLSVVPPVPYRVWA